MPLYCALQTLIQVGYISFLLTIGCSTVAIYTTSNDVLKIFDSHARDSFGMADACGTCVLLEVNSINNLLQYFQNLYKCDVLFELKGVKIAVAQFTENTILHTNISQSTLTCCSSTCHNHAVIDNLNSSIQCYAICFYSICFSVINPCSYWNDLALNAIAEHGDVFYQKTLNNGQQFTCNKLPSTVNIYGANVDVVFGTKQQGTFSPTSISDKLALEKLILDNATENTGFLLWTSSYCLSCIFQHGNGTRQKRTKYFLVACDESQTINLFENVTDSLINKFCNIVSHKLKSDEIEYNIQFLSCSCQSTKPERQKITQKHKSSTQKKLIADRKELCKLRTC